MVRGVLFEVVRGLLGEGILIVISGAEMYSQPLYSKILSKLILRLYL